MWTIHNRWYNVMHDLSYKKVYICIPPFMTARPNEASLTAKNGIQHQQPLSVPLPLPLPHSRSLRRPGLRVHSLRQDRVDHQGRDGLQRQREALRRLRLRHRDPEPGDMGRVDGTRLQLLREGQSRHFQRPRTLPSRPYLRSQPHLRRLRPQPRLVRQLRRGDVDRGPHTLQPAAVHGRAVAGDRYVAVRAHGDQELLQLQRRRR